MNLLLIVVVFNGFYVFFSEIDNPINSVVENSVLKSLEVVISEVQR